MLVTRWNVSHHRGYLSNEANSGRINSSTGFLTVTNAAEPRHLITRDYGWQLSIHVSGREEEDFKSRPRSFHAAWTTRNAGARGLTTRPISLSNIPKPFQTFSGKTPMQIGFYLPDAAIRSIGIQMIGIITFVGHNCSIRETENQPTLFLWVANKLVFFKLFHLCRFVTLIAISDILI